MTVAGIISDTHGLLRPEAVAALEGADVILHAGDVGNADIIGRLSAIAPVHAVLGNKDEGGWLPQTLVVEIEQARVFLLHNLAELTDASGYDVVVSGHSHKPLVEIRDGVLFVNPGSAGPRRFRRPVTVARMHVNGRSVRAEIVQLSL